MDKKTFDRDLMLDGNTEDEIEAGHDFAKRFERFDALHLSETYQIRVRNFLSSLDDNIQKAGSIS